MCGLADALVNARRDCRMRFSASQYQTVRLRTVCGIAPFLLAESFMVGTHQTHVLTTNGARSVARSFQAVTLFSWVSKNPAVLFVECNDGQVPPDCCP